jgi:hypothetical protein
VQPSECASKARKRGESTTGLSKRKRVIAGRSFFLGVAEFREQELILSFSSDWGKSRWQKILGLLLTNFFYLSNIRPVS